MIINNRFLKYIKFVFLTFVFSIGYAETPPANTEFTQEKPIINLTLTNPNFVIKLKSNPTTGYSWFLRDYNASLINPVKHKYQAPNKNLMGASGYEYWTFKAKPSAFTVPQQTTIRFVYARPWESSDSSTQLVFKVITTAE